MPLPNPDPSGAYHLANGCIIWPSGNAWLACWPDRTYLSGEDDERYFFASPHHALRAIEAAGLPEPAPQKEECDSGEGDCLCPGTDAYAQLTEAAEDLLIDLLHLIGDSDGVYGWLEQGAKHEWQDKRLKYLIDRIARLDTTLNILRKNDPSQEALKNLAKDHAPPQEWLDEDHESN